VAIRMRRGGDRASVEGPLDLVRGSRRRGRPGRCRCDPRRGRCRRKRPSNCWRRYVWFPVNSVKIRSRRLFQAPSGWKRFWNQGWTLFGYRSSRGREVARPTGGFRHAVEQCDFFREMGADLGALVVLATACLMPSATSSSGDQSVRRRRRGHDCRGDPRIARVCFSLSGASFSMLFGEPARWSEGLNGRK